MKKKIHKEKTQKELLLLEINVLLGEIIRSCEVERVHAIREILRRMLPSEAHAPDCSCSHEWHEEEMRGLSASKFFCTRCNAELITTS